MSAAKNKHLTLNDRMQIQKYLTLRYSFRQIGILLDKDPTTIAKEILKHTYISSHVGQGRKLRTCIHCNKCELTNICPTCNQRQGRLCRTCGYCEKHCKEYVERTCPKLEKPPYTCNSCNEYHKCTLYKHLYDGDKAHKEYLEKLSQSRQGIMISDEDIEFIDTLLTPLIKKQGQSIHHIYINHKDEIMFSEKTLYKAVDSCLLGVRNIDLPLKVKRRERKSKPVHKVDPKCREGRTLNDFNAYISEHPDTAIVQMDTVEGRKGGKVLLTLHFTNCNLMIACLRDRNDSKSVIEFFDSLDNTLGNDNFKKLFPVILTDNGSEFSNPSAIESHGCKVFYCNPSAPYEKGACEVNHEFIRRISPKGQSFNDLSQDTVNLMMSHINSYGRKILNDKSPIDCFTTLYSQELLELLNIKTIKSDDINLTPSLIKKEGK